MPSAGAVVPPAITPLRKQVPGRPSTHIDTATYIELDSETPGSKVYFSTDGTKPNPFQLKVGGRESTFKYRGPFSLKGGRRTLKAVAVSRDGLQESNVVTKTFQVDDVGPPDGEADLDDFFQTDETDVDAESTFDLTPVRSSKNPLRRSAPTGPAKRKGSKKSKEAWGLTSTTYGNGMDEYSLDQHYNKVQIPEGPFNPTNYSGTQMNFWGPAPASSVPQIMNGGMAPMPPTYSVDRSAQLGYLTDNMIRNLEQPKLTVGDVRKLMEMQQQPQPPPALPAPPPPEVEIPKNKDPEAKKESPGDGDWRGQLEHIYAHLIQHIKTNIPLRIGISEPKMGAVVHANFDEEDDAFLLTVSIRKSGHPPPKPKAKPTQPPATKKIKNAIKAISKPKVEPPPPEPPKKPVEKKPPTKPVEKKVVKKPEKKPEKKKEEAYFETEEYERNRRRWRRNPPSVSRNSSSGSETESKSRRKGNLLRRLKEQKRRSWSDDNMSLSDRLDSDWDPDLVVEKIGDKEVEGKPRRKKWDIHPYFLTEDYAQEGTLKPWEFFDSEHDCEVLRKAMKGMGTDEDAIVNVLGYRCCTQRVEIGVMFKTMFGKNLRDDLDGETSGDFGKLVKALCMGAAEYDASEIHKAIKGLGTDDDALIEILCTRTNAQIKAMKAAYKTLYSKEMEKDVKGDTSGDFKKLLVAQMSGNRSEDPKFDRTAAKNDAKALYEAGEKKWGTDESTFNMILCQRSFPHLRAVFEEYKALSGKDMEDVIKSEFSGDIKNGFLTVVRCIKEKPAYFAKKLQKSMKGLGTDDSAMVRVVVSRCESDMVQIKQSFETQFGGTLADWIRDDTSGDYQALLLALIGERPPPEPTQEEREATEGEPELEEVEEENIEYEGTVKPADPFDAQKDCEVLKKAMKGFGTDEEAIIITWGPRSNDQRQEIKKTYKEKHGKDLMKELKSETSGSFWHTLEGLGQLPADLDANQLRKAMKGLGTDEDCLIEILCTRDNEQMVALQEAYTRLHRRKLEEDIISETSGNLKRLLVSMVQANRPTGNIVDRRKARKDAKDLLDAGEEKWGTDESRFNVILCSRSFPQLRATFEEYEKLSEKDIEQVIKDEMSGDIKDGMITLVRCIRNRTQQFAKRLHDAMAGLGTKDDSLIRVCVSRSEVDMVQIKEHYKQMFDVDLGKDIAGDISGDYRKLILHVVAETQYLKK